MAQKGKRIRYNQETRNDFQKALRKLKKKSYEGINEKGKSGDTILHQAAGIANQKTVRLLIEKGADVNAKNEREETPLYRAACMRYTKNVEVLIENGANVNAVNLMGRTALHIACTMSAKEVVEELLKAGADTEIKDELGAKAIVYANKEFKALLGKGIGIPSIQETKEHFTEALVQLLRLEPKLTGKITGIKEMKDGIKRKEKVVKHLSGIFNDKKEK